jgi:hypothetical protein
MDTYDDYSYLIITPEKNGDVIKYGFKNSLGEWLIDPVFEEVTEFDDWGNCLAKFNNKWGRINYLGVWEINPDYEELSGYYGDLILGSSLLAKTNGKWGVIDSSGGWLINPQYDSVEPGSYSSDSKDCYFVTIFEKCGVLNEKGDWLLNPIYDDSLERFDNEGYCGVKLKDRWGFINYKGDWLVPPTFYTIFNFHLNNILQTISYVPGYNPKDGLCIAKLNKDDKWGFINREGDWAIEPEFDFLESRFNDDGYCFAVEGSKEGVIDRNGNWVEIRQPGKDLKLVGDRITSNEDSSEKEITASALAELDQLVGLYNVKEEIKLLYSFVKTQKARLDKGLKQTPISYHCVFTGSPGTGKNTVARIVASIYKELGILKRGHLVETDRSGLVGGYIGQTAIKVNQVVDSALDGVLFIDEAYSLVSESSIDFGQEAINTLMKRIEDDRNRLIVVLAGYKEEMDVLIEANPGFKSRFNTYINFNDYTPENLISIFKNLCDSQDYLLSEDAETCLTNVIANAYNNRDKTFGNARFVRNLFEKTVKNLSRRIIDFNDPSKELLSTIEAEDLK